MGIFSNSLSLTRYKVEGQIQPPVMGRVLAGLTQNTIEDIDHDSTEAAAGWTSLQRPYEPNFEGNSFVIGTVFAFSLRMDQKRIPLKLMKKQFFREQARLLRETGRQFLSKSEKKNLKEQVQHQLLVRLPPMPSIYDLIWNYEGGWLWFFSTLKSANEQLETLFSRSFGLQLIRLFGYTLADSSMGLTPTEKDILARLTPVAFVDERQ
jgi:DNA recombination-dependent growth factor C